MKVSPSNIFNEVLKKDWLDFEDDFFTDELVNGTAVEDSESISLEPVKDADDNSGSSGSQHGLTGR